MSCAVERIGLALFAKPADGLFVWERLGHIVDSLALEQASERAGIMLAPARSCAHISSARRGCRSTWPSARTRVINAGCGTRRPTRRRNAARGDGGNST